MGERGRLRSTGPPDGCSWWWRCSPSAVSWLPSCSGRGSKTTSRLRSGNRWAGVVDRRRRARRCVEHRRIHRHARETSFGAIGLVIGAVGYVGLALSGGVVAFAVLSALVTFVGFEFTIVSTFPLASEAVDGARARYLAWVVVAVGVGRTIAGFAGTGSSRRSDSDGTPSSRSLRTCLRSPFCSGWSPNHQERPLSSEPRPARGTVRFVSMAYRCTNCGNRTHSMSSTP